MQVPPKAVDMMELLEDHENRSEAQGLVDN